MCKTQFRIAGSGYSESNIISLTEVEWNRINKARSLIFNIYYIEQKYDLMISNYYEFEENLLQQALDQSIWYRDGEGMGDALLTTARKIINLISSIIFYAEHVERRHIKKFEFGEKKNAEVFGEFISFLKDSVDYRFVKGLRNLIAHRDLPMDSYSYSSNWDTIGKEEEDKLGHYVVPTVKKEKLIADRKINSNVVNEMDSKKGKIDLRVPIRKTIAGISKIANTFRKSLSPDYQESKSLILETIDRYKEIHNGKFFQCQVEKLMNNEVIESESLHDEMFNRVEVLFKRNKSQEVLERRYVHNRL